MAATLSASIDQADPRFQEGGGAVAGTLAAMYVSRRGFTPGTVPEARVLREHCDHIVTRMTDAEMQVVCVVDRCLRPDRYFGLSAATLEEIGRACLKYLPRANVGSAPMSILVIEVTNRAPEPAERARLAKLESDPRRTMIRIAAGNLDTASGLAWLNAPRPGELGFLESAMPAASGMAEQVLLSEAPESGGLFRLPPLSTAIVLFMVLVFFGFELIFAVSPWTGWLQADPKTLIELGGATLALVRHGEAFRVLTATFLHATPVYLLGNSFALIMVGRTLERPLGWAWYLAILLIGGVCGAGAGLLLNPEDTITVGPAGSVMALFAAGMICSLGEPSPHVRRDVQVAMLWVLIPAVLPEVWLPIDGRIDYAEYLGGLAAGVLLGLLVLKLWPSDAPTPRLHTAAVLVDLAGAGVLLIAICFPLQHLTRAASMLIPDGEFPTPATLEDPRALAKLAPDLWQRFPNDPRAHTLYAAYLRQARDSKGAEQEARVALAQTEGLSALFPPEAELNARADLAMTILQNGGDVAEARSTVQRVCTSPAGAELRTALRAYQLCE